MSWVYKIFGVKPSEVEKVPEVVSPKKSPLQDAMYKHLSDVVSSLPSDWVPHITFRTVGGLGENSMQAVIGDIWVAEVVQVQATGKVYWVTRTEFEGEHVEGL